MRIGRPQTLRWAIPHLLQRRLSRSKIAIVRIALPDLARDLGHWVGSCPRNSPLETAQSDGTFRHHYTVERRISFTELPTRGLRKHSKVFGPFALEFEVEALRHMAYYREREWRLIGNTARDGVIYTKKIEQDEAKNRIIEIDPEFWKRSISGGSYKFRRVDEALVLPSFENSHIANKISRVIAPQRAVRRAQQILEAANFRTKVISTRTAYFRSLFESSP